MFDRDGSFIRYKTEADLLAILEEDHLNPDLPPRCQQRMVVDAASFGWNEAIEYMVDVMGFSADDHGKFTAFCFCVQEQSRNSHMALSNVGNGVIKRRKQR